MTKTEVAALIGVAVWCGLVTAAFLVGLVGMVAESMR